MLNLSPDFITKFSEYLSRAEGDMQISDSLLTIILVGWEDYFKRHNIGLDDQLEEFARIVRDRDNGYVMAPICHRTDKI